MTKSESIKEIIAQRDVAIAGVSRRGKNIGNSLFAELKKKEYNVYQVNPNTDEINGEKCYRNFEELPQEVSTVILTVKPEVSENVVKEAYRKGIKNVWMQLGSESDEAITFCENNNINVVYKECFFMFAEPVESIHKFHRWIWKILGKLPS